MDIEYGNGARGRIQEEIKIAGGMPPAADTENVQCFTATPRGNVNATNTIMLNLGALMLHNNQCSEMSAHFEQSECNTDTRRQACAYV